MTEPIAMLRDAYLGQTAYVVGKGPSLINLRAEHFSLPGPVITLNHAVRKVQSLGIPNPILSLQKDGPWPHTCAQPCRVITAGMAAPGEGVALLVSARNSVNCFANHRPRYVFDTERDFGLYWSVPSIVVAVRLVEYLGCTGLIGVSLDVGTTGDTRTCYDGLNQIEQHPDNVTEYVQHVQLVNGLLAVSRIRNVRWMTPLERRELAVSA